MISMEGSFYNGKWTFNHPSHSADCAIPAFLLDGEWVTPDRSFHGFVHCRTGFHSEIPLIPIHSLTRHREVSLAVMDRCRVVSMRRIRWHSLSISAWSVYPKYGGCPLFVQVFSLLLRVFPPFPCDTSDEVVPGSAVMRVASRMTPHVIFRPLRSIWVRNVFLTSSYFPDSINTFPKEPDCREIGYFSRESDKFPKRDAGCHLAFQFRIREIVERLECQ